MNADDSVTASSASDADFLLQFSAESPVDPAQLAGPKEDDRSNAGADDHGRIERVERQIERALIEITTLKSDLATLVSAVEDMRKRTSRPPDKPAAAVAQRPARRLARGRAIAAIVFLITAGAAWWGLMSVASSDLSEPLPIESESSGIIEPPPVVDTPPPQAVTATVVPAAITTAVVPARERLPPARDRPPRAVTYVGTLTIDAEPAGDVFLNRKNVGRTPPRLEKLRAGSHLIWIERDGYRRWTRVVAVGADRISRVSASLDPVSR